MKNPSAAVELIRELFGSLKQEILRLVQSPKQVIMLAFGTTCGKLLAECLIIKLTCEHVRSSITCCKIGRRSAATMAYNFPDPNRYQLGHTAPALEDSISMLLAVVSKGVTGSPSRKLPHDP